MLKNSLEARAHGSSLSFAICACVTIPIDVKVWDGKKDELPAEETVLMG